MREKTRVFVFFESWERRRMFFFEVPLSLFCEKKQTKTIITSDMILLLLSYTNTLLHSLPLRFDGPPLVLFGSRAIDVPRIVSRRGFDRSQFHRSLLPEDSGFAFERRRGYGGEKTG